MPNANPDEALAEARRRDRIADGDAARTYARTHELPPNWLREILKRLLIELERCIKAMEDDHAVSGRVFNEHAGTIDKCIRALRELFKLPAGKALLTEAAEAENNDEPELRSLAHRLLAITAAGRT